MHEWGIVTGLLEVVEGQARKSGARRVRTVNLVVGERSGIVDESLRFYFDLLSAETLAAGASVTVRRTPMRFHCEACREEYTPAPGEFACAVCGAYGRLVDDGAQMTIESIEIER